MIQKFEEYAQDQTNEGTLKFSDGEQFDTSGELRTEERHDGWYVIGKGHLIPVDSEKEGQEVIDDMLPQNDITADVVKESLVDGDSSKERSIDLRGPEGNAFAILGLAKQFCNQLNKVDPDKYDWDKINKEMTSSNYTHLVKTFDSYFGDYVTIYNADVLEESNKTKTFGQYTYNK